MVKQCCCWFKCFCNCRWCNCCRQCEQVYAEGGSALGYGTSVAAAHTNSVAIGAKSATGAANQVSFGHKVGDRNEYGGSNLQTTCSAVW